MAGQVLGTWQYHVIEREDHEFGAYACSPRYRKLDRLQQIAIWEKEAADLRARIAAIDADIEANPMDPEVLRKMEEDYESKIARSLEDLPANTILFEPGRPVFDERMKTRNSLSGDLPFIEFLIDKYKRRETPDDEIVDEATFAKEYGLDLPSQPE